MSPETLDLEVPADVEGLRLDRFLTETVTDRTRSALRRLILEGRVRVDGRAAVKPGQSLSGGMRIEVELPVPEASGPRPEAIAIDVVFEDESLLVVDKPAGMVVHPGHGNREGTLVHALLGRGTSLAQVGGRDRPGIVHRLDRGTSGLLLVAKTDETHRRLQTAFAERRVSKHYLALVWGRIDPTEGTIDRGIGRSRTHRTKMTVRTSQRRAASTRYRTRESMPGFAWLDVYPETGRTHQIRVHLQSIHHPIVGDDTYGGHPWRGVQDPVKRKALRTFERLALHAATLELDHPLTGRRLRFESPVPEALLELLAVLRGS